MLVPKDKSSRPLKLKCPRDRIVQIPGTRDIKPATNSYELHGNLWVLQHRQSNKHRQALPLLRPFYLQKLDCLFSRKPPRSSQNLWCSESSLGIAQGRALRFILPEYPPPSLPFPTPSFFPPGSETKVAPSLIYLFIQQTFTRVAKIRAVFSNRA